MMLRWLSKALFVSSMCLTSVSFALTIDEFDGTASIVPQPDGIVVSTSLQTSGVIGGTRGIHGEVTSTQAPPGSNMSVVTMLGIFGHSQDFNVSGYSILTWDGDQNATLITNGGLGGIDFTQDGGNAIELDVVSYDFPRSNPLTLAVRIYDATDHTKFSRGVATLNGFVSSLTKVTIPFAAFVPGPGASGPADFRNVGAVSLKIAGEDTPDTDFGLEWIGTNGMCRLVPDEQGKVIDQCGVCGGDGTSCLDCNGVLFGPAVLDRCGVCNGDGKSCVTCFEQDLAPISASLDGGAKKLEARIKVAARRLLKVKGTRRNQRFVKKMLDEAHRLQVINWVISWQFPRVLTTCDNEQVCTFKSYESNADEYRLHNDELLAVGIKVINKLIAEAPQEAKRASRYMTKIDAQYQANHEESLSVPIKDFSC